MKKRHTDFYYRLRLLNDKIHIFTSIFYNKVPSYQMNWYHKKKQLLEDKLRRQKEQYEEEILLAEKKILRKKDSMAHGLGLGDASSKTVSAGLPTWNLARKKASFRRSTTIAAGFGESPYSKKLSSQTKGRLGINDASPDFLIPPHKKRLSVIPGHTRFPNTFYEKGSPLTPTNFREKASSPF